MLTYKEALEENRRMVEFRKKHIYSSKPHNDGNAADDGESTGFSDWEENGTYKFYDLRKKRPAVHFGCRALYVL